MLYEIKNWDKFQHYKDRNPPWIKLHFELLSSKDWVMLSDASRVLAITCMLIASRNDGVIDGTPKGLAYLKRVAYLNQKPNLKPLIDIDFLTPLNPALADASTMLADARPETETETETEGESKPSFPFLESQFPRIIQALKSQKPTAKISTKDNNQFKGLTDLVRLDNYSERDVVGCLAWVFTSPDKDAVFWCKNVSSFVNLRTKKTGDTLTKFDKIFLAYQDATKKTQQQKEPEPELRDTDLMHLAMSKYFPKKSDQETKTLIADFFDTYIIGKVDLLKVKQEIENTQSWKQFQERILNGA